MTTILLVDDEPLIIDSLTYSLKREGFDVKVAYDGTQALQSVQEFEPDLIVLDLMLPDISGLEVCRRIRTGRTTPVIMLTARGEEIDRVLGLEVGADDYLAKPFHVEELQVRLQALIRRVLQDEARQGTAQGSSGRRVALAARTAHEELRRESGQPERGRPESGQSERGRAYDWASDSGAAAGRSAGGGPRRRSPCRRP